MKARSIRTIAYEIINKWHNVHYGAMPYLDAMRYLDTVEDSYALDSAKSIINYFLSNASTWRGEDARRIKAELKQLIK